MSQTCGRENGAREIFGVVLTAGHGGTTFIAASQAQGKGR
jgi:hypothetical protein